MEFIGKLCAIKRKMIKENSIIKILLIALSLAITNSYLSYLNFLNWQKIERIELVCKIQKESKCYSFNSPMSKGSISFIKERKWDLLRRLRIQAQKNNTQIQFLNKKYVNSIKQYHFQINQLTNSLNRENLSVCHL